MIMAKVYGLDGSVRKDIELPEIFRTDYRPDIIKKAVLSAQSAARQPYGSDELAGKRTSAHYHGRRRTRNTMMGRGIARMARIHGKVGYMSFRARFVPQAVKGRQAHPPQTEKVWSKPINKKEMTFAIKSSLAAAADRNLVAKRGHLFDSDVPVIVESSFENLKKIKDVFSFFKKIGLEKELERCKEKKCRSGKAKMRGRKYAYKKGPLLILSGNCDVAKAAANLPGFEVSFADSLDIRQLAPGTQAGRLLVITEPALEKLEKAF